MNQRAIQQPHLHIIPIRPELVAMTDDELCFPLSRFVLEVRNSSDNEYPPQTIYEIIISIQLFFATKGREVKLLKDEQFKEPAQRDGGCYWILCHHTNTLCS